jgi:hypothetical protein
VQLETFDGADLTALFPDLSAREVARMRAAARGVDVVRLRDDAFRWDWFPEHLQKDPVDKSVQLSVLGTTLTLFNKLGDWLELELWVVREQRPRLTVSATIEVACWCDPDHNLHVLSCEERLVGAAAALTEAFESAAAAVVRWAGESHDPLVQRAAAGLPNPEPR